MTWLIRLSFFRTLENFITTPCKNEFKLVMHHTKSLFISL